MLIVAAFYIVGALVAGSMATYVLVSLFCFGSIPFHRVYKKITYRRKEAV